MIALPASRVFWNLPVNILPALISPRLSSFSVPAPLRKRLDSCPAADSHAPVPLSSPPPPPPPPPPPCAPQVDRSVTGLIAQQQCCGPLQLPVSDVAVMAQTHFGLTGIATSIGEQPIKVGGG